MVVVQESEIVNLLVAFFALVIVEVVFRRRRLSELSFFYTGFFSLVGAFVFTVLEGVFWGVFFNGLEHLCYAAAGLSFAVGCYRLSSRRPL